MFSLGYQEVLLIAVVALVVVSPQRLPEFLRSAGRMTAKVRRAANELQREINAVADEASPMKPEVDKAGSTAWAPASAKHRIARGEPLGEPPAEAAGDASDSKPPADEGKTPR